MEPNKLEKQFKKQLDAREIQPSAMAWNKLEAMLTVAEPINSKEAKQKPKTKFSWLYVAASFVGFLLLGTVYFSQNDNSIEQEKNGVILENTVAPEINKATEAITTTRQESEQELVANVLSKINSGRSKLSVIKEKSNVVTDNSNQNQAVEVSINNNHSEQELITSKINTAIVDELVAGIGTFSKIESRSDHKPLVKVNAAHLLSQVDGELELSFREKVINKVNKNYQTVKVAITNRNLE